MLLLLLDFTLVQNADGLQQSPRLRCTRRKPVDCTSDDCSISCAVHRHAGRSRLQYVGIPRTKMLRHLLQRNFFHSALNMRVWKMIAVMFAVFTASFFAWALAYYALWRLDKKCFIGFKGFLSAFLFSMETQMTIGYGSHAIGDCWAAAGLATVHTLAGAPCL